MDPNNSVIKRLWCMLSFQLHVFNTLLFLQYTSSIITRTCIYGPPYAKTRLQAYANNEGTDQPLHQRSLIKAFTSNIRIIGYDRIYEQEARWYITLCLHRMNLNLSILHRLEDTFSLGTAHTKCVYLEPL